MSDFKDLKELVLAVYKGEIAAEDLTDSQQLEVISALRQVAESLLTDPETMEVASKMIAEMVGIGEDEPEPVQEAIDEAESRGSVYWEIESDRLH